jgi:signal transduction histidine kinase
LETGNELAFNEPFNLKQAITDAAQLYINEASRRKLQFNLELSQCPDRVVGDSKKIQTVVANLTGNARKPSAFF